MKLAATTLLVFTLQSVSSFVIPNANTKTAFSTSLNSVVERKTKTPVFDEVCDTTGVTLKRFMSEVAMLNPELTELTSVFGGIDTACKALSNLVKRSQLPSSETLGYQGAVNIQGEDQKKLDVLSNDILKRALRFTGRMAVLASEEEDLPVDIRPENAQKSEIVVDDFEKFVVVFDPLDGSSNVDAGCPTGTIIGIYEHDDECEIDEECVGDECEKQLAECMENTLQPGTKLIAAAYCLYSSSCFLTLTLGSGVYMFVLDEQIGEFILSKPNVQIPEESSIVSFNEANFDTWDEPLKNVVKGWQAGTGASGKTFSSRYIGAMVGDVHRTLLYGGIFGYPRDEKSVNGKLRLLYEGAPMSFIMEQAGGLSTTGRERVMEITPDVVHQRVPIVMGSKKDVEEVIAAYAAYDAA